VPQSKGHLNPGSPGVELHRFEALGSSTPVDRFRLSRSVWSSLKNWNSSTRHEG
jgi:hypothetical protein